MEATTPLMRQYQAAKQQVPNALLLFRLGDFYELFYEDAITAARELEITLTSRNKERGEPIPMCGVPFHAADGYIGRLIQRGYRVAICEQMEEAGPGKKLVRRELSRVITPGTATDSSLLRSHENNYLAGAFPKGERCGLAFADLSTGEFRATEIALPDLSPTLETMNVRELLLPEDQNLSDVWTGTNSCLETRLEPWIFGGEYAHRLLLEHFRLLSLDGCGLGDKPLAAAAAGAVLHYLRDTQKSAVGHLNIPAYFESRESMLLDAATVRNLELVEPLFAGESHTATLIHVLDKTSTGMGGRLLRRRLLSPSCDRAEIEARLDAVAELTSKVMVRGELRKILGSIQDLERLLARITLKTAGPRELLALGRSLGHLPAVAAIVDTLATPACAAQLTFWRRCTRESPRRFRKRRRQVWSTAVRFATGSTPASTSYGVSAGIAGNISPRLRLVNGPRRAFHRSESGSTTYLAITSRFPKPTSSSPARYERKQTRAGLYHTRLKELESKVLDAEDKSLSLERSIFEDVREYASSQAERIKQSARQVAELDVAATLAQVGADNRYRRPKFSTSGEMRMKRGAIR